MYFDSLSIKLGSEIKQGLPVTKQSKTAELFYGAAVPRIYGQYWRQIDTASNESSEGKDGKHLIRFSRR